VQCRVAGVHVVPDVRDEVARRVFARRADHELFSREVGMRLDEL
jgi:hypothetical protein